MYRRILVPLDGSKLAEAVLPHVEDIAKGCNTEEVILVSVTERIAGRAPIAWPREAWPLSRQAMPPSALTPVGVLPVSDLMPLPRDIKDVPVVVGKMLTQAQRYLARIAKRLEKKRIKVRVGVLLGNPAEEITAIRDEVGADLILMASHGRSGVSKWAYGSVADKVLRTSSVPVLLVRVPGAKSGV